jgi:hypothetical protein
MLLDCTLYSLLMNLEFGLPPRPLSIYSPNHDKIVIDKSIPTRPTWDIWIENLWGYIPINKFTWFENPWSFDLIPPNF